MREQLIANLRTVLGEHSRCYLHISWSLSNQQI
jgi:hypothetical protein